MRTPALTAVVAILALAACDRSQRAGRNEAASPENVTNVGGNAATETMVDSAFVTEAMMGDNGEVAIGELAQTQGESQAVKDFGKLLVADHGAHKQELGALAQAAGIKTTDDLSDDAKANLEKLEALRGHAFDREFKTMMVEDHTKDIGKYEKQASSGDADTAALAQKTLPTLRKHLEAAKSL